MWPAAGLVDTPLTRSRRFELHGTEIPQRGVPPPGIIEAFDVIEHIGPGLGLRAVGLQRGEEALDHRIVSDVARPTYAAGDAMVGQKALERLP